MQSELYREPPSTTNGSQASKSRPWAGLPAEPKAYQKRGNGERLNKACQPQTQHIMIKFRVINRKNPQDRTLPEKHYAFIVNQGARDFESLARVISKASTISETDCLAVLNELELNIMEELREGRTVKLGKLGFFKLSFSSKGVDTAEEVTADLITKARILFYPSKRLKKFLTTLDYQKAA
tara:strand:- start:27440 stop:27982 length:543 start_codon:yes stop_codon:yes gene_type:complete